MKVIATVLLVLVALLIWPPGAAFACEPLPPEAAAGATHTRRTEAADFVLLGTITDTDGRDFAETATVGVGGFALAFWMRRDQLKNAK